MRPSLPYRWVDLLPWMLGIAVGLTVLSGFAGRLAHPYDLEWMEGGMLAHAWRLQGGQSLYPEPGPDFVPFIYPPGYPAILALLAGMGLELSIPLGRGLSILGTLGATAALLIGVGRDGGRWGVACLAAAIFWGTWPHSGTFFDLARPDALSLGLLAGALVLGLERHRGARAAAGWLLAAAFLCKHNAAAFGIPMLLGIWARDGRRGAVHFALHAIGPALLATIWLQWATEGRFLTYLLAVPGSHPIVGRRILPGTPGELGYTLGFAWIGLVAFIGARAPALAGLRRRWVGLIAGLGAGIGALVLLLEYPSGVRHPGPAILGLTGAALGAGLLLGITVCVRSLRRGALPWEWIYGGGVGAMALGTAALMRGHHGGFLNVWMPLHWVAALAVGIAVSRARGRWPGPSVTVGTALAMAVQLAAQWGQIDLDRLVPTEEDRAAGDQVVEALRERCAGPVLSPYAAWLPVLAEGEPSVHLMALWDIVHHEDTPFPELQGRMEEAVASHRWDCVVEAGRFRVDFGVDRAYQRTHRFELSPGVLMPKVGWRVRVESLHTPVPTER